ncbi:MAG TPA: hypothetical protein VHU91_10885 [Mycobacteriales bacterium]|jgi:hypothetical protein|nr:hypothetical protein [Mycobacteriales bacterium]
MTPGDRLPPRLAAHLCEYDPAASGPRSFSAAIEVLDQALALCARAIDREERRPVVDHGQLAGLRDLHATCFREQRALRPADDAAVTAAIAHYGAVARRLRADA